MTRPQRALLSGLVLAAALAAPWAWADDAPGRVLGGPGLASRPPVSALALPMAWFDPSRLQISTSVSVGTSPFGRGTDALQTLSLSYRFGTPLWMNVSIGNRWGMGAARNGESFFLEGLDVAYRPHPNLQFQIHYQDVRSPLQLSRGYGTWSP